MHAKEKQTGYWAAFIKLQSFNRSIDLSNHSAWPLWKFVDRSGSVTFVWICQPKWNVFLWWFFAVHAELGRRGWRKRTTPIQQLGSQSQSLPTTCRWGRWRRRRDGRGRQLLAAAIQVKAPVSNEGQSVADQAIDSLPTVPWRLQAVEVENEDARQGQVEGQREDGRLQEAQEAPPKVVPQAGEMLVLQPPQTLDGATFLSTRHRWRQRRRLANIAWSVGNSEKTLASNAEISSITENASLWNE
jgi:hypothetical protein